MFKINQGQNIRLIIKHSDGNTEVLSVSSDVTLQDSGLYSAQTLIVDLQKPDGTWNIEEKKRYKTTNTSFLRFFD